ncbi:glutathione S-transferase [Viridothelium virens]|uniref:Glutathione S-transferase n=1 Tax=Viridothelium virens TaxID=1048519 RepID=A0A6A6HPG9_VIRVR|nr:glutathione S-transferase [Viridothelium virens]
MPNITLYRVNNACSLAPHILLRELQISFTPIRLVFGPDGLYAADGSLSSADYNKVNQNSQVPTLVVDGSVVTELPAILTCIADMAPDRKLLGTTPMEKVRVYEWMNWLSGTMHGWAWGSVLRPARFVGDAEEMYETVRETGRKKIKACYERVESKMDGKFAVGDRLTAVDFYLYVFWRWGSKHEFKVNEKYPKWRNVMMQVEKMDSVRKALEEEDQPLQFASNL